MGDSLVLPRRLPPGKLMREKNLDEEPALGDEAWRIESVFAALGGWPLPTAEKDARVDFEEDVILDAVEKPPKGVILRRSKETRPELVVELVGPGKGDSTATEERGESDTAGSLLLLSRRLLLAVLFLCADDAGGDGGLTVDLWDAST